MSDEEPKLTPTQDLIMEVLMARYRLGENIWPFGKRFKSAIKALGDMGLVNLHHGNVENTVRASLTERGKGMLGEHYVPPINFIPALMSFTQVAEALDLDMPALHALVDAGRLQHQWVGVNGLRHLAFLKKEIDGIADYRRAYLDKNTRRAFNLTPWPWQGHLDADTLWREETV